MDFFPSFHLYFLMENKTAKFSEMQYKSCCLNLPQEFRTFSRRAVTWLCRAHVGRDLLLAQLELLAANRIKELGRAPQVRFASCQGGYSGALYKHPPWPKAPFGVALPEPGGRNHQEGD